MTTTETPQTTEAAQAPGEAAVSKYTVFGVPHPEKEVWHGDWLERWYGLEPFLQSNQGTERLGLAKKMVFDAFKKMSDAIKPQLGLSNLSGNIYEECEFEPQWQNFLDLRGDSPAWIFINRRLGHVVLIIEN